MPIHGRPPNNNIRGVDHGGTADRARLCAVGAEGNNYRIASWWVPPIVAKKACEVAFLHQGSQNPLTLHIKTYDELCQVDRRRDLSPVDAPRQLVVAVFQMNDAPVMPAA